MIHKKINNIDEFRNLNFILVGFLFIFFNIYPVSANIVCGQVLDSEDNFSASWNYVDLYYPDKPQDILKCEVSPAENKFCCDCEGIPGKSWKIGDIVNSEIFNNESGYFSGPVSVKTTGEGYDIFPVMQLKKAIKINYPTSKLIFSNKSLVLLNASFSYPYNQVFLENNINRSILCDNCTSYYENISINFGMNHYKIISSNNKRNFSYSLDFAVIKSFNYFRDINCPKCNKNKVKSNQNVKMTINLNFSDDISGLELKEYVPVSWDIIDSNYGEVKSFSETHNVIIWNISGKNIRINYSVKSPDIFIFPIKFLFRTEVEDYVVSDNEIIVTNFFPFFALNELVNLRIIKKATYSRISPERPLVIKPLKSEIKRVAIYPKKTFKNVNFIIMQDFPIQKLDNSLGYYLFYSDLKKEDIEKIYIEFQMKKELMQDEKYDNITFYIYQDDSWVETNLELFDEDNNFYYYKTEISSCDRFAIVGVRNEKGILSFISNLLHFLD